MAKAIALLSGGLDSTLAILTALKQGIKVDAVKFVTPFDCSTAQNLAVQHNLLSTAKKHGFAVSISHLDNQFIDMVINPKHGYGQNMNPCIDCRILMLKKVREMMVTRGADFIITGEVLGQRPMSQRKDMLYHIDKEAGATNYVLRPLSAKLMRITFPEAEGMIDRDVLYAINGRTRKPQMALAKEFSLEDYPSPAGGCLLTEPNYAYRLKDLLKYDHKPSLKDISLLKIGRHFRFSPFCKIIVGRDETENNIIESLSADHDRMLIVDGYGSPITLIIGEYDDNALKIAASICARYSDAKNMSGIAVTAVNRDINLRLMVSPAGNELIETLRIELKTEKPVKV